MSLGDLDGFYSKHCAHAEVMYYLSVEIISVKSEPLNTTLQLATDHETMSIDESSSGWLCIKYLNDQALMTLLSGRKTQQ